MWEMAHQSMRLPWDIAMIITAFLAPHPVENVEDHVRSRLVEFETISWEVLLDQLKFLRHRIPQQ